MSSAGVVQWLNANAGAVSALAALLSAVATLAIAAFSFGTWRAYRLQSDTLQAARAVASVRILNMTIVTWSYLEAIASLVEQIEKEPDAVISMKDFTGSLPNFRKDVKHLLESHGLDPAVVANLNIVHSRLFEAEGIAESAEKPLLSPMEKKQRLLELFKVLEAAGTSLMGAGAPLEDASRLLAPGKKSLKYPLLFGYLAGSKVLSSDRAVLARIQEMNAKEAGRLPVEKQ